MTLKEALEYLITETQNRLDWYNQQMTNPETIGIAREKSADRKFLNTVHATACLQLATLNEFPNRRYKQPEPCDFKFQDDELDIVLAEDQ